MKRNAWCLLYKTEPRLGGGGCLAIFDTEAEAEQWQEDEMYDGNECEVVRVEITVV